MQNIYKLLKVTTLKQHILHYNPKKPDYINIVNELKSNIDLFQDHMTSKEFKKVYIKNFDKNYYKYVKNYVYSKYLNHLDHCFALLVYHSKDFDNIKIYGKILYSVAPKRIRNNRFYLAWFSHRTTIEIIEYLNNTYKCIDFNNINHYGINKYDAFMTKYNRYIRLKKILIDEP